MSVMRPIAPFDQFANIRHRNLTRLKQVLCIDRGARFVLECSVLQSSYQPTLNLVKSHVKPIYTKMFVKNQQRMRSRFCHPLLLGGHLRVKLEQMFQPLSVILEQTTNVDCSTIDVETTRQLSAKATKNGFDMLDAPVSGGPEAVGSGKLSFMTGGSDAAFARAKPLLEHMGAKIQHFGEAGSGQAAKACHNMICGIIAMAVCEGFALAEALGLDADRFHTLCKGAAAQSWVLENRCPVPGAVPGAPSSHDYAPGFAAALMAKDLRLAQMAAEAEVCAHLEAHTHLKTDQGLQRVVRHGHGPEREILTGTPGRCRSGAPGPATGAPMALNRCDSPRRSCRDSPGARPWWTRCCRSSICAASRAETWQRRCKPWSARMRAACRPLSAQALGRLKSEWKADHARWQARDLSARTYVYLRADGIYFQGRMEDARQCMLVLIGATPEGKKELVGLQTGFRESARNWGELPRGLKARGLAVVPELATGDGALGFWKALDEVWPTCRHQRCRVHKTSNVLNKLPKSARKTAKADLRAIWMAESRADTARAMGVFAAKYQAKYPKAVECLTRDRAELLAFYDFPAEHWQHLRTTNPIESVFATVRHRTVRSRGCLSNDTAMWMVFKLIMAAAKTWHRLRSHHQLSKLVEGVRFNDGIEASSDQTHAAA